MCVSSTGLHVVCQLEPHRPAAFHAHSSTTLLNSQDENVYTHTDEKSEISDFDETWHVSVNGQRGVFFRGALFCTKKPPAQWPPLLLISSQCKHLAPINLCHQRISMRGSACCQMHSTEHWYDTTIKHDSLMKTAFCATAKKKNKHTHTLAHTGSIMIASSWNYMYHLKRIALVQMPLNHGSIK